ncbi:hypothetical protein MDA_GLEAN10000251 [Myotis davidii]|uniref:Uncharacterized protein n=1 Tax=Myotis davidii TaxID=225400 RepID=L5MHZ3_MYODS|nr:hypothetical protein MDA_GLEAN10000251 [Myotis davidii]
MQASGHDLLSLRSSNNGKPELPRPGLEHHESGAQPQPGENEPQHREMPRSSSSSSSRKAALAWL